MKDYKIVNGISFDPRTPDKVCQILANYCGDRSQRVRIFLATPRLAKIGLSVTTLSATSAEVRVQ